MASRPAPSGNEMTEHCEQCDNETIHEVDIEIRAESDDAENVAYSREPYRVAVCTRCSSERVQRMNNA